MANKDSQKLVSKGRFPRVELTYDARIEGKKRTVELPFVTGVFANFSGKSSTNVIPVSERRFTNVDAENFDRVLASYEPAIVINFPDPNNAGSHFSTTIYFFSLNDFLPNNIDPNGCPLEHILNDPDFLRLEATWRGLNYLVNSVETGPLSKVRIFDIKKDELATTLKSNAELTTQNPLVKQTFTEVFCEAGGQPFGCFVGDYYFNQQSSEDTELLKELASLSVLALAPFISGASAKIIGLNSFGDFVDSGEPIQWDRSDRAASAVWQALRESDSSRLLYLTLPRILIRQSYGISDEISQSVQNLVRDNGITEPCYANAAYAMAVNIRRAYREFGWPAPIRGVESGGAIEEPIKYKNELGGFAEVTIKDLTEIEFAHAGYMPLVQRKGSDATFIGAQSVMQLPGFSDTDDPCHAANINLSGRMPYMLSILRFTHYLKCLYRDSDTSPYNPAMIEELMSSWLSTYILDNPETAGDVEVRERPLSEASVTVTRCPDQPKLLRLRFFMNPYFMLYGMTSSMWIDTPLAKDVSSLRDGTNLRIDEPLGHVDPERSGNQLTRKEPAHPVGSSNSRVFPTLIGIAIVAVWIIWRICKE